MIEPTPFGPFPLGINNIDDPRGANFQLPSKPGDSPPALREASNVDLDRQGGLSRRVGRTLLRPLTLGHSGFATQDAAYYVDGSTLYRFDPEQETDIVVATGLDAYAQVRYAASSGLVFWLNGPQRGAIVGSTPVPWGVEIMDQPTVTVTGGGLPPGRYLVATAAVVDGIEGGCREIAQIELSDFGGIGVIPNGVDPRASHVNVYLSDTNGTLLYYHSQTTAGTTLSDLAPTLQSYEGVGGYPPPAGHLVAVWGGFLIVAQGSDLYFSEPGNPHRFHLDTDIQLFSSRIAILEPVVDGFYVGLEAGGTYWVTGTEPRSLTLRQLDDRLVAEGMATRIPASRLPWLKSDSDTPVPVWATQSGLAVGMPGGAVQYPQQDAVAMDTNYSASLAYVERPGLRQIIASLKNRRADTSLGATDRMTLTVTRGGVPLT